MYFMKLLTAFFRLIRYPNLIYIFLTQYLLQYAVVKPVLNNQGLQPTLNGLPFFLLTFSTMLIAAAGYMINDYFDVNIDQVNKPQKIVVDKLIRRRWVMAWHIMLNAAGILIALYLAWQAGKMWLALTQVICCGLLWFYSTSYKRQLLVGNIVIALLTALTVMVVGFYEPQLYDHITAQSAPASFYILRIIGVYAVFAFLISMIREIVKDLEDLIGDNKGGCHTMPIVWGVNRSKWVAIGILTLLLVLMAALVIRIWQLHWYAGMAYLLLFVFLPLCVLIHLLLKATQKNEYHAISTLIKVVMLTGILSMLFFKIYL